MTTYEKVQRELRARPKVWLVTGAAGFIGSHLVEKLLGLKQRVIGLDNLSPGKRSNLSEVRRIVGSVAWKHFRFIKGDIRNLNTCKRACKGVDYVLHQAALGSVPRSMEDPITSNDCNVTGFLNMLVAAREAKVKRFVYASSSSVYGDDESLPKVEDKIGQPVSPYAVTKYVNELYAGVFARCYGLETVGLRYFNVFGPRQDPNGPYAAVIPKWIAAMKKGGDILVYGDGETSRDFCYIDNVVQINLLATSKTLGHVSGEVFNVACNRRTTLDELFTVLRDRLLPSYPHLLRTKPTYRPARAGDIRDSQADLAKANRLLHFIPVHQFVEGINQTLCGHKRTFRSHADLDSKS